MVGKQESKKTTRWFINKAEKKIRFRIIARTQAGASREHLFATHTWHLDLTALEVK